MTVDLHSAVRTAVDAQRAKANRMLSRGRLVSLPAALLRECDWADDVLARHTARLDPLAVELALPPADHHVCTGCGHSWPCGDARSAAAAFGVETGETP